MYRIGFSKDIHIFEPGNGFVCSGVFVGCDKKVIAHSDGDVVYHAVGEALLGSLSLGDLGKLFPDNDEKTKDIDSAIIVRSIYDLVLNKGYEVNNVDVFISLESPKIGKYTTMMRSKLAELLKVSIDDVSIKVGTNEGVGPVGENKAIEAYATVLIRKRGN